jgi:hypothetical protein
MNSVTSAPFWRLYRQLPAAAQQAARKAYQQFQSDPTHPGLRFKRLAHDPRLWSVRITRSYRAVGLVQGDTITWFWIGDHDAFERDFPV